MDGVEIRQRETVQRLMNKLNKARELRAEKEAAHVAASDKIRASLEEKTREAAK
jgi:hypothetical protein